MYHYDIKSLNLGTDTLRMMRSRTSLLQMLAAESACVMNGTHDGFWDAVHVDEVIINVVGQCNKVFIQTWTKS